LSFYSKVQNGFERENKRKVIQFASIFMLLVEGRPMTNYKDLWPLYHEFLKLKNTFNKHWSDFFKLGDYGTSP